MIELMIVVAIIGILSAIIIPRLAKYLADEDQVVSEAEPAEQAVGEAQSPTLEATPGKESGALPESSPRVESLALTIRLKAGHRLDGFKVNRL